MKRFMTLKLKPVGSCENF